MSQNNKNDFLDSIAFPIERKFLNQELIEMHIEEKQK